MYVCIHVCILYGIPLGLTMWICIQFDTVERQKHTCLCFWHCVLRTPHNEHSMEERHVIAVCHGCYIGFFSATRYQRYCKHRNTLDMWGPTTTKATFGDDFLLHQLWQKRRPSKRSRTGRGGELFSGRKAWEQVPAWGALLDAITLFTSMLSHETAHPYQR